MRGRIPTFSVGDREETPRVRVLLQWQCPKKNGWDSLGARHIMAYGYELEEVFKAILKGLGIETRGRKTCEGKKLYRGSLNLYHRKRKHYY